MFDVVCPAFSSRDVVLFVLASINNPNVISKKTKKKQ